MPKENLYMVKNLDAFSKIVVYVLVFLIPLFFLPWTTNVLDFNKQALLILLVSVSFFAWMIKSLIAGRIKLNLNFLYAPIILFLLVYAFSTIFSLWRYGSFWGWPQSLNASLLTIICLSLFWFFLVNIFERKDVFYLTAVSVFSGFIAILFGMLQILGRYTAVFDFTKNPSFNTVGSVTGLGFFAAVLLPLIVALGANAQRKMKILFTAIAVFAVGLLVLINTPIVWWTVALASGLFIIFSTQKKNSFGSYWLILPILFLAVSLLFIFFKIQIPGLPSRPIEVFLSQKASFNVSMEALKDKLLLGSGPGTFVYDFSKYKDIGFQKTPFWNIRFDSAASKAFNILSATGILGAFSFLFLVGILLFFGVKFILGGFKKKKAEAAEKEKSLDSGQDKKMEEAYWFMGFGIFASIATMVFVYAFYPSNLTLDFVFFFLLGCFAFLMPSIKKEFLIKPSSLSTLAITVVLVLVFALNFGVLIFEGQRYAADISYLQGAKNCSQGKTDDCVKNLGRAVSLAPEVDLYWRELSQVYLQKMNEEAQRSDLPKDQISQNVSLLVQNAVNSARRATNVNPVNVVNWSVLGYIYQNLVGGIQGTDQWAINSYNQAIDLEPTNPYFPTQQGLVLIAKAVSLPKDKEGDKEQILSDAQGYFEKAIAIKSDYAPAHFQLAMISQLEGKTEEAIQKLEETKKIAPANDIGLAFQLGLLYYQDKNYQKAQAEMERTVVINPNYSNALYFLGLIYDKQGEKNKAIEKFTKVLDLNPGNEEVIKILDNLKAGKEALEGIIQETPPQVPIEEKPSEAPEK